LLSPSHNVAELHEQNYIKRILFKMSPSDTLPLYADTPLALLSTPAFLTGKNDPFTMGASHMTLSHNSLIRGFNSIYQQAPRISQSDYSDFFGYCLAWHRCVEEHHMHEEVNYFPEIEKATGQKGVMDGEVEQHGKTLPKTKLR